MLVDAPDDHHLLPRPAVLHRRDRHSGTQGLAWPSVEVALSHQRTPSTCARGADARRSTSAARSSPPASSTRRHGPLVRHRADATPSAARTTGSRGCSSSAGTRVAESGASTGPTIDGGRHRLRRAARLGARRPDRAAAPARLARRARSSELAAEAFGRPAVLDNDATAARGRRAPLRRRRGARSNMVYLTVSTGVGGGVVLDGTLHRGPSGNGGELGHVTVDWHGRVLPRLRPARLPRGLRLGHVDRRARARGRACPALTATDVAAAARDGRRAVADAVWDETVEALACGITSIVEPLRAGARRPRRRRQPRRRAAARAGARARPRAGDRAGRVAEVVPAALGDAVGVVGAAASHTSGSRPERRCRTADGARRARRPARPGRGARCRGVDERRARR